MKKINILFLFLLIYIFSCKERFEVQYFGQYIEIPNYNEEDYSNLLYNQNKEIVNNSIIMLMGESEDIMESYDATDDKAINNRNKKILNKIFELLYNNDQLIVTSSIRFLRVGLEKFNNKNLLIEKLIKIKSNNINVKYEQINALNSLFNKDTKIDINFIKKFINDKSWLVSRSSFKIIDTLENDGLRKDVILKYKKTKDQFDKILLLDALKTNFNEEIFNFYKNELLTNMNQKIRNKIFQTLKYAKNKKLVLEWIKDYYNKLKKDDIIEISDSCYDDIYDDFSFNLFLLLLNNNFNPYDSLLTSDEPRLFSSLIKNKKDNIDKFKIIDKILLNKKEFKDKWIIYKAKNNK